MIRELHEWVVALWRDHRVLALLLGVLLLRLIFHFDDHFTIRDADFFPTNLQIASDTGYRGGRVIPMLLGLLWAWFSGNDPFLAKQIFSKVLLLVALPGFVMLAIRSGQGVRSVGFGAVLFLANAQLFALYDTLGPYFLLMAVSLWQIVFALDARDARRGALLRFGLVSGIALLCHRNALVTTGLTMGIVFLWRRNWRLGTGAPLVFVGIIALATWKLSQAMRFDALENAHQAEIYGEGVLASVDWAPSAPLHSMIHGVLSLVPGWGGVMWPPIPYLAVATLVLTSAAFYGALGVRRELRWLSLLGLGAAAGLVGISEALATDLFFQPNHATYGFVWMPLLVLLLGRAMADGLPRLTGRAVLVMLVSINLWQGYGFRDEAFDFGGYEEFVQSEHDDSPVPRILVPAFMANEYAREFPEGSHLRPFVENEKQHNDFTTLPYPEFFLDIITYDELGIPLYRYGAYRRYFEAWAARSGLEVKCRERQTFTSCHVKRVEAPMSDDRIPCGS